MLLLSLITALIAANAYFAWYCHQPQSWPRSIVKTLAVGALAVAAGIAHAPYALIYGLALGSAGDFFLSRQSQNQGAGKKAFLAGLVAFALAHLAYIWLMLDFGAQVGFGPWALVMIILAVAMAALLFRHAGRLRWRVLAYVAIIAAMGIVALGLPYSMRLGLVAALCFILSDAVLGLEMFVLPQDHWFRRFSRYIVWGFYWAAQALFLFAFSLVWLT